MQRPQMLNQQLRNYCLQSTNNFIKKLLEKKNKENTVNLETDSDDNYNLKPDKKILIPFMCVLSISSFAFLYYNSKR